MNKVMNYTVQQYHGWMDTEDKLVSSGYTDEDDLLYIESIYNDIIDLIDYNMSLLLDTAVDSDTTIGTKAIRTMDYVAACIEQEEEHSSMGRIIENRFYDACKKIYGCTNVVRASLQDDVLACTDFFIYGFRIDVTLRDKPDTIAARDIYHCENNRIKCTANIVNKNAHNTLPAPVLSLRFNGDVQGYQPLYHLIKEHLTPMLLEFNRMCHVLKLSM
jgi:hypothetical protein